MQPQSFGSPPVEVLVCGTLVMDIRVRPFRPVRRGEGVSLHYLEDIALQAGGLVSNTGLALARLGCSTGAVGRLGDDALGDILQARLVAGNLRTEGIRRVSGTASAAVIVCIDEAGERTFHVGPGANHQFDASDIEQHMTACSQARAIMVGYLGELPLLDPHLPGLLASLKRQSSALIMLETAGPQHQTRELLDACLPFIDVFIPSWDEARELTGARTGQGALDNLARVPGPSILGVKLGARGCLVRDAHGSYNVPAYPTTVVDATGAGDAFLAGFVAGLLRGQDTRTACKLGNMAGALMVSAIDGATALPPFEALLARVHEAG